MVRRLALGLVAATLMAVAGGALWFHQQGYHLYVVKTGSMVPTYLPGDVVVDRAPNGSYRPGEVVTVQISASGDLVTHRFTHADRRGLLHTKGDANATADAWALRPGLVRGVVSGHVPKLGFAMVFLRQKEGIGGVMTSALAVILLWGLCFPKPVEETQAEEAAAPKERHLAIAA